MNHRQQVMSEPVLDLYHRLAVTCISCCSILGWTVEDETASANVCENFVRSHYLFRLFDKWKLQHWKSRALPKVH